MQLQFRQQDIDRFWSYVEKTDGCWLFTGTPSQAYGLFVVGDQALLAHRVAYLIAIGDIPDGLLVCHECDVKRCVRPAHLYPGTPKQNSQDAVAHGLYPTGDDHWSIRMPDRKVCGEKHWSHAKPDLRVRGERNGLAKLTEDQVAEIRHRFSAGGVSQSDLALEFGVNQTTISKVVLRKIWSHQA